jgi:hypothetical protein
VESETAGELRPQDSAGRPSQLSNFSLSLSCLQVSFDPIAGGHLLREVWQAAPPTATRSAADDAATLRVPVSFRCCPAWPSLRSWPVLASQPATAAPDTTSSVRAAGALVRSASACPRACCAPAEDRGDGRLDGAGVVHVDAVGALHRRADLIGGPGQAENSSATRNSRGHPPYGKVPVLAAQDTGSRARVSRALFEGTTPQPDVRQVANGHRK